MQAGLPWRDQSAPLASGFVFSKGEEAFLFPRVALTAGDASLLSHPSAPVTREFLGTIPAAFTSVFQEK